MRKPVLDGMLLASTDPKRLGEWYAAAFEPQEDVQIEVYRAMRFGGFDVLIDQRDDIGDRNPEPGRMILNFTVEDARAAAARLSAAGTTWVAELEDRDGSLFATATDPDGNYVQLIQLSREHRADMIRAQGSGPLASSEAFSSFAVDDVAAARRFYGQTLGLQVTEEGDLTWLHLPGGRDVLIYPKPDHQPAPFTILNFPVDDIDRAVSLLAERGVSFESYAVFEQDAHGIHRSEGGPSIAWFTDPAGNVLSVLRSS
jgi:predicted enzyme related to lactoylglutathione lyase